MVVRVQPEERQVRVHHLRADALAVHIVEDPLGITGVGRSVEVGVGRVRPAFEARRVQLAEVGSPVLAERLDHHVLRPDRSIPQPCRKAGEEEV